jgi:hypothetical protein
LAIREHVGHYPCFNTSLLTTLLLLPSPSGATTFWRNHVYALDTE